MLARLCASRFLEAFGDKINVIAGLPPNGEAMARATAPLTPTFFNPTYLNCPDYCPKKDLKWLPSARNCILIEISPNQ